MKKQSPARRKEKARPAKKAKAKPAKKAKAKPAKKAKATPAKKAKVTPAKKAKATPAKKAKATPAKKAKATPRRKAKPARKRAKAKPAKREPAPAPFVLRSLAELLATDEPAWPLVRGWIDAATKPVEVLPAGDDRGQELVNTQVTVRSPMGAVIHETGGLLVDHGWLRILGSGHPRLPRTVSGWSTACGKLEPGAPPPLLLVADDVLGGFFALDGGALGPGKGDVYYFAPDSCEWEPLEIGYSAFLRWCLSGDLAKFYREQRWPGWEEQVAKLDGDQGLLVYPPLWASGPPVGERHRGAVPLRELWGMHTEVYGPQLHDLPDGTQVTLRATDG